jgi:hypothetical protein
LINLGIDPPQRSATPVTPPPHHILFCFGKEISFGKAHKGTGLGFGTNVGNNDAVVLFVPPQGHQTMESDIELVDSITNVGHSLGRTAGHNQGILLRK